MGTQVFICSFGELDLGKKPKGMSLNEHELRGLLTAKTTSSFWISENQRRANFFTRVCQRFDLFEKMGYPMYKVRTAEVKKAVAAMYPSSIPA